MPSYQIRLELLRDREAKLVLFGAGSAINFILDALQWCTVNTPARRMISVVYTTRDYDLFKWAMSAISTLVPVCEAKDIFFDVKMAFTGMTEENSHDIEPTAHMVDSFSSGQPPPRTRTRRFSLFRSASKRNDKFDNATSERLDIGCSKPVKIQPERFDLYEEIEHKSTVFCQGSAGLKNAVEAVCEKVDARFYGGRGGAREDQL